MKPTLILLIAILSLTNESLAQKDSLYAPVGAKWVYTNRDFFPFMHPAYYSGWTDECVGDTLIFSYRFAKIERRAIHHNAGYYPNFSTIYRGVRNDSLIEISNGREEFLLDFSWGDSDTVMFPINPGIDTLVMTFKVSDTAFSASDTLRVVFTQNNFGRFWRLGNIYEGIGSASHKLFMDGSPTDGKDIPKLLCYEENTGFRMSKDNSKTCDQQFQEWIALNIEEQIIKQSYRLLIKDNQLQILSEEFETGELEGLRIISSNGKIKEQKTHWPIQDQINIVNYPSGVYWISFKDILGVPMLLKFVK